MGGRTPDYLDGNKTEHIYEGWGYDSRVCKFCRVDCYDNFIQHARQTGGGEYCEDIEAERAAYEESERTKPERTRIALDKVRKVLSIEEYNLLNLRYFAAYRPVDRIVI